MKLALLALAGALFVMAPTRADEKQSVPRAWLDSRGVLTIADLEKTLDTRFTGEERTKMETLLAQRNAALQGFNSQVTQLLRDKLAVSSDAGVAARVEKKKADDKKVLSEAEEAEYLERIRRRQPRFYQGLLERKRKEDERKKKEAEAAQKAAAQTPPSAP